RRAGRGRAALRARLPYRGGADRPCPRATRAARTFLRQSYCDRAAGRLRSLRAPCAVTTQIRHSRVRRGSWGKPMTGPFWRNEPNPPPSRSPILAKRTQPSCDPRFWRKEPNTEKRARSFWRNEPNGRRDGSLSPHRPGGRTQRIEARLLLIAQRIVEFRERRLHGLHRGERGVEPLLHRLDPTRGGQRLVGRAIDLEAFRRLDRRIPQFVERGALRRRGLDRLGDAIDRQVGHARRLLIAKPREIALILGGGVGLTRRRDGVEARLLLVAERLVEALERRTHGLHRRQH